jgi:hypothetical protein
MWPDAWEGVPNRPLKPQCRNYIPVQGVKNGKEG